MPFGPTLFTASTNGHSALDQENKSGGTIGTILGRGLEKLLVCGLSLFEELPEVEGDEDDTLS